jgi:hypothetical protein
LLNIADSAKNCGNFLEALLRRFVSKVENLALGCGRLSRSGGGEDNGCDGDSFHAYSELLASKTAGAPETCNSIMGRFVVRMPERRRRVRGAARQICRYIRQYFSIGRLGRLMAVTMAAASLLP